MLYFNVYIMPEGPAIDLKIRREIMFERVKDPADPRRCQATTAHGQCTQIAKEGGSFCQFHSDSNEKRRKLNNYNLTKFQARLQSKVDSPQVKSLRDEIGILRMTLESILNRATCDNDLILQSGKIADLATRIEKLVVSCNKLESSMGELLDKQVIMQIATQFVSLISECVNNPETISKLATGVEEIINNIGEEYELND